MSFTYHDHINLYRYSKKAARIRKLLLGEDADVDDEDEDDEDDDEEDIDVDDDDRVNASSDDEDDEDDDEDDEDDDEEEEEEDDEGEDDNDDGNDDGNNDMDHYIDEPKSRVKVKENSTDFFVEADTEADVAASKAVKSDKSKQSKQQASIKPKNKRSHAVKDAEEDEVVEEGWDMAENDDDEGEIDREMTYTYKPEDDPSDKPLNERTPLDVAMQKIAEKRRARKLGKKERLAELQQQEQARKAKSKSDRKYKKAASNAAGDDTEGDDEYNMRSLEKEEKLKSKLKVGKKNETLNKELKKLSAKNKGSVDFEMNFSDDRFAAVVDGDARYAIDPTSTLFKQTAGMKSILEEQRKRKRDNDPDFAVPLNTNTTNNKNANKNTAVVKSTEDSEQMDKESNIIASTGGNAKALANKLKKKFNK